jgi:hypothetical protein
MTTQKEALYHCKLCGRSNFVKRAAHKTQAGSANPNCPGDFAEQSATPCFTCHFKASRGCPDLTIIKISPWRGCGAWVAEPISSSSLPSLPSVKSSALTILTKDQAALVDHVKQYHKGVYVSYEHQIQYAFMAGLKLTALKDSCPHGNAKDAQGEGFRALCASQLPELSRSVITRYLDFTRLLSEKMPAVGIIQNPALLLKNGDLPEKEKAAVLKAVYEAADGKTWTAFYRDLNLVRQKQDPAHHPRKDDPKAEIDPDLDGTLWKSVKLDILMLIHPDETELEEAETNDLKTFLTVLKAASMRVEGFLKARRVKPAPKKSAALLLTAEANKAAQTEAATK